jgi:plasmid stabilization system protein ParE
LPTEVRFSVRAERRLTTILTYIEGESLSGAARMTGALREATSRLADFPMIGRSFGGRPDVQLLLVARHISLSYVIHHDHILIFDAAYAGYGPKALRKRPT